MILSRVAEACFWMMRHMERAENTARLLRVNQSFVLDVSLPDLERWRPVVVVSGEEPRFVERLGASAINDGDVVQDYMVWDDNNPVSIASCAYWARENARTIRDVITLEMWEKLNVFHHWMRGGQGRRLWRTDRDAFYAHVQEAAVLFQGVCHTTMLHEQPFDFMLLGLLLERAGQTARIIDIKHHAFGSPIKQVAATGTSTRQSNAPAPPRTSITTPLETAQVMALLRSCSATQPFSKRSRGTPSGHAVVEFLVKETAFPRSVLYCLERAMIFVQKVRPKNGIVGDKSVDLLLALIDDLQERPMTEIVERGIHEELTRIIDSVCEVCQATHLDYFDPSFEHHRAFAVQESA